MKFVNYFNRYSIKLKLSMIFACIIGTILIMYAFYSVFSSSQREYKIVNNNIFNVSSYIVDFNMTCVSNKTENKYTLKEMYKKVDEIEMFKFEYIDFLGNKSIIVLNGNKYKVENENQIARYVSLRNQSGINIYSLSTIINIINCKAFNVVEEKSEVVTKYIIDFKDVIDEEKSKQFDDIIKNRKELTKAEFIVSINRPIKLCIFSDNEPKIIIDYISYESNTEINDYEFEV